MREKPTKSDLHYYLNKVLYVKEQLAIEEAEIKERTEVANKLKKKMDTLMSVYKEEKAKYSPENELPEPDKSRRHRMWGRDRKEQCFIIRKLSLLFNSFFWHDVKYNLRKIFRFPIRVIEYAPYIFNIEDWDFNYFMTLMQYQLDRMQKNMDKYAMFVGSELVSREMREAVEHMKRFKEIDKYTIDVDTDEYLNNTFTFVSNVDKEGKPLGYQMAHEDEKLSDKHFRIHEAQRRLEDFHWRELWKLVSKKARRWGW